MPVDNLTLQRWRQLDAATVLLALAEHAKPDASFVPTKNAATRRWHANVRGREFELLLTGPKFWDSRAQCGGGGAVDLTMHLAGFGFRCAATVLKEHGL